MKLLTKALKERFFEIGSQEDIYDPLVIARFFNPAGAGTWFATEYSPDTNICFGYVSIFGDHNDEWGDFLISELEEYRGSFGLGIERDTVFFEKPISEIMPKALLGRKCSIPTCPRRADCGFFCEEHAPDESDTS